MWLRAFVFCAVASAAPSQRGLLPQSDLPPDSAGEALQGDHSKSRRVVVVSPGTTGTHAVYHLLCDLGLSTVHWENACDTGESCFSAKARGAARARLATAARGGAHARDASSGAGAAGHGAALHGARPDPNSGSWPNIGTAETPSEYVWDYDRSRLIWDEHKRMQTLADQLSSCAENKPGQCHTPLSEWMANVSSAIKGVERQSFSITDTPYPGFFHLLTSAKFGATFVFASRNSTTWAEVRVGDHGGGDPICLANGTRNWANGSAGELSSPFDLWGCASACNASGATQIADCFTRIDRLPIATAAAAFAALEADVKRTVGERLLTLEIIPDTGPHLTVDEMIDPVATFLGEQGVDMPCADASILNSAQEPFPLQGTEQGGGGEATRR